MVFFLSFFFKSFFLSLVVLSSSLFYNLVVFFGCFFFLSLCLFLVVLSLSLILVGFSHYSFFLSLFISSCLPLVVLSSCLSLYSILAVFLWFSSISLCKLHLFSLLPLSSSFSFCILRHFRFLNKFVSSSSFQ
jgi:hypothetical protein